jgi:uncharacterized membrane protein YtjA (UPF0391 family)
MAYRALAADLTGFIQPSEAVPFRHPAPILFLRWLQFSWFRGSKPPGTFGPRPDYFCSRCAMISVALTSKQKLETEVLTMLSWVVTFLIVALIAGILGFGGIAGVSIEIAKTIFFIAVVLFLVSAVVGLARGRTRV